MITLVIISPNLLHRRLALILMAILPKKGEKHAGKA